jgi:tight adherence protein C
VLSTAFGVAFFIYVVVAMGSSGVQTLLLALVILLPAAMLPLTRVQKMAKKRKKAIVRALPDAMDLLVTSVEAGLSVDAAFALVAEKTTGPKPLRSISGRSASAARAPRPSCTWPTGRACRI